VNGVDISGKEIVEILECDVEKKLTAVQDDALPKASFFDLFKHPVILKRSIIIMLLW